MRRDEAKLEEACKRLVKLEGGIYRKLDKGGGVGFPDAAIWLRNSRHILVEYKTKKGRVSDRQMMNHSRFRNLGFTVWVVVSEGHFKNILYSDVRLERGDV